MKRTFDITDTHTIERAGCVLEVDVKALPEGMLAALVLHGLTQKVGDAAASAAATTYEAQAEGNDWTQLAPKDKRAWKEANVEAIQATARGDMEKVIEQLGEGVWGAVRSGAGLTPLDKMMVSIIRPQVAQQWPDKYKAAKESDRVIMCREYMEKLQPKQQEALAKMAEARIAAEAKARAEVAALDLSL